MPPVPLAINAYKRADAFQPEVICRNVYVEEDKSGGSPDNLMRIDRPGLTSYAALPSPIRGMHREPGLFGGVTFAAAGSRLYRVTLGASTDVGGIGTGDRALFAANYQYLFILSVGVPFRYDGTAISGIVMPDAREVADIDVINNFLLLACPDGRWYYLPPGATTIDALHFYTAESSPDGIVACKVLGDEVFFFGLKTTEVWQASSDPTDPFLRAGGRTMSRGCLSRDAVLTFDNSILWVGDDEVVYRYGGGPVRVSDHGIEERLRKRTDLPSAHIDEADGHKFYVLRIPGQGSFAYDPSTQQWHERASLGQAEWRPHCSTRGDGFWLLGDKTSGAIWMFDPDASTDAGATIERVISGTVPQMSRPPRVDSFAVGVGAEADFTLQLRWRDGRDPYPATYEELDVRAPVDVVSIYRLGALEQPFRTFELRYTAATKVRISGAMGNEAWQ